MNKEWFKEYNDRVLTYLATPEGRAYSAMVSEHINWSAAHVTIGKREPDGTRIPQEPQPLPSHDRAACNTCVLGREQSLAEKVGMYWPRSQ